MTAEMKTKTRRNTKSGKIATAANSTPKVEKDHGIVGLHQKWRNSNAVEKLHQKCMLRCVGGLSDFLKEHQGEWYSPYEIHRMGGGDIRSVKNRIDYLANKPYWTTDKGCRLEIAQRGRRIYCVRFVKDVKGKKRVGCGG